MREWSTVRLDFPRESVSIEMRYYVPLLLRAFANLMYYCKQYDVRGIALLDLTEDVIRNYLVTK